MTSGNYIDGIGIYSVDFDFAEKINKFFIIELKLNFWCNLEPIGPMIPSFSLGQQNCQKFPNGNEEYFWQHFEHLPAQTEAR